MKNGIIGEDQDEMSSDEISVYDTRKDWVLTGIEYMSSLHVCVRFGKIL